MTETLCCLKCWTPVEAREIGAKRLLVCGGCGQRYPDDARAPDYLPSAYAVAQWAVLRQRIAGEIEGQPLSVGPREGEEVWGG